MQPYLFPYIGYFQLIAAVDQWVVFDTPQYVRHGWVNRNRILHPTAGPKYIVIPLAKHEHSAPICELKVHPTIDWKSKIVGQLKAYYGKKTKNAQTVIELVEESLDVSSTSLSAVLVNCLRCVCDYLDLKFNYVLASELEIDREKIDHAGQWALEISKCLNATEYINPVGGKELFNATEFEESNIKLSFLTAGIDEYDQRNEEFVGVLSILDVMIWNSQASVKAMLQNYLLCHVEDRRIQSGLSKQGVTA